MTGRKIAMIGPSLRGGGLERVVRDLALIFASRGEVPAVFTVAGLGVHADALIERGITVVDCRPQGRAVPGYPRPLIKALQRFSPDILHAHSGTWLPSAVAAFALRCPLVFTDHGRYPPEPWGRAVVERLCYALTDELVCVSTTLAEYDQRFLRLGRPPTVIENGIDLTPYAEAPESARDRLRAEWGLGSNDTVGIVVARLEPVKNHAGMVEALMLARQSAPSLRLVFLGDGSLADDLKRRSHEAGLDDQIRFLGFRDDVPTCLRAADFLLVGSTTEGLPINLLEGLAAGLPVVATAVGGIPDALGHPTPGFLVPPGDLKAMAAAMVRLAQSIPERRQLSTAATQRSVAFSLDRTATEYAAAYTRAQQRGGRNSPEPPIFDPPPSTTR